MFLSPLLLIESSQHAVNEIWLMRTSSRDGGLAVQWERLKNEGSDWSLSPRSKHQSALVSLPHDMI